MKYPSTPERKRLIFHELQKMGRKVDELAVETALEDIEEIPDQYLAECFKLARKNNRSEYAPKNWKVLAEYEKILDRQQREKEDLAAWQRTPNKPITADEWKAIRENKYYPFFKHLVEGKDLNTLPTNEEKKEWFKILAAVYDGTVDKIMKTEEFISKYGVR